MLSNRIEKVDQNYWSVDENGTDILHKFISPGVYEQIPYPHDPNEQASRDDESYWSVDGDGRQVYHQFVPPGSYVTKYPEEPSLGVTTATLGSVILDNHGQPGKFGINKRGRKVWFQFVCPGVYKELDAEIPQVIKDAGPDADRVDTTEKPGCMVEENGNDVWYTYVGPGKFEKIDPESGKKLTPPGNVHNFFMEFRGREVIHVTPPHQTNSRIVFKDEAEHGISPSVTVFNMDGQVVRQDSVSRVPIPIVNPDNLQVEGEKIYEKQTEWKPGVGGVYNQRYPLYRTMG